MNPTYTENERRLRSIVRALVSPAVWLAVAVQLGIAVLSWMPLPAVAPAPALRVVVTAGLLVLLLYVAAGGFRALAHTRDAVSLRLVFDAGRDVFAPFVWFAVKVGLLLLALAFALALVLSAAWGDRAESAAASASVFITAASGMLGYVLVYWLPWVFVYQDFRVMPTLHAALGIFWERLAQSAFVAILTLGPTVVAAVLPDETPLVAVLIISWVNLFAAWIAFIYCAEWMRDHRAPAPR